MGAKEQTRNRVAIAGQVRDAETKLAIPSALVEISQEDGKFKEWLTLHALQYGDNWKKMVKRPDQTLTASDGCFHFLNLPDGQYKLTVSLPGTGTRYGFDEQEVQVSYDGDRIKPAPVNLALPPTAIKGKITGTENKPVFMAKVQVEGSGESTFSNKNGEYLLMGLQVPKQPSSERILNVKVFAQGYEVGDGSQTLKRGETKELNIRLTPSNPAATPSTTT